MRILHVRTALSLWLHPGGSSENGFSAIKLTALGRPQFLVSAGDEVGQSQGHGQCICGGRCFGVPGLLQWHLY